MDYFRFLTLNVGVDVSKKVTGMLRMFAIVYSYNASFASVEQPPSLTLSAIHPK